ncbi:MAG: GlsB/YeaQ/YmgE family stress response membrane protein, partial [Bacteroidaceae bacterium]|nr:GlsB/YeaQ/YmgE family stress response membrane protein [Bacteroidaceae bacterium]
ISAGGILGTLIVSVIGAVVLLWILSLFSGRSRNNKSGI